VTLDNTVARYVHGAIVATTIAATVAETIVLISCCNFPQYQSKVKVKIVGLHTRYEHWGWSRSQSHWWPWEPAGTCPPLEYVPVRFASITTF